MKTISQLIYMIRNNIEFDESATKDLLNTLCNINNEKIQLNNTIEQLRKNNSHLKNELDELTGDFEEKCDECVTLEAENNDLKTIKDKLLSDYQVINEEFLKQKTQLKRAHEVMLHSLESYLQYSKEYITKSKSK